MDIFENEEYKAEATHEQGCQLSVKVFVKPKTAQKAYQKAVKQVNKQISIPGFRKGRAPDRTVIGRYSAYVEQEWKDFLVNDACQAALDLTKIYPMNKDSLQKPKIESCSQEEGAVIQVRYEHYPNVPTIDFSELTLPHIENESINEEKINEVIEEVRRAHADWEDITGRAVQEGDFVDVSIDSIEKETPQPIVEDRRFEVNSKRIAPWLKKLLIGLNCGETIEGVSEVDPEAEERTKSKFKPTKVRVTLHAIKKIIPPEVNDDFAQKLRATSLEDLKAKIRRNLEHEVEGERLNKRITALENTLLEKYRFELPSSVVAFEKKARISRRAEALKEENLTEAEIKAQEKGAEEQINAEVDDSLRLHFLNKQIVQQGKLTLTRRELDDEITRYVSQNPHLQGRENDESVMRDLVSRMATSLLQRKAKEYALEQIDAAHTPKG